jgi:hypothetical protein
MKKPPPLAKFQHFHAGNNGKHVGKKFQIKIEGFSSAKALSPELPAVSLSYRDEEVFVCDSHLNRFSQNSHAFDNCHHNYPTSSPPCFWEYLMKL